VGFYFSSRVGVIENEAKRQEQNTIAMYRILEGADTCISPLRRAPAVWGLTGDDISVLSIHGTSTPTLVKSSFLVYRSANTPTGEERDTNVEQHLHIARPYPWQCLLWPRSRLHANYNPIPRN
jgi:hypothetical protein